MKHIIPFVLLAGPALADPPQIVAAEAIARGDDWRFNVTIRHPDTGWDHYADGWRVEDAEGRVLGTRVLAHPHVNEQPFERSLTISRASIQAQTVYLRAKCSVDGWNTERTTLTLDP